MTSKGWSNLPVELLRQVFDHLHHITVANHPRTELHHPFAACQLVCRSWSREAQKRLYNQIDIANENIAKFVGTITVEAPQTASLVKHVQFLGSLTNDYHTDSAYQLFTECGELTSIKADSPEAFNQIIWPTLLRDDVHLPKLQAASLFNINKCIEHLLIQFQLKYRHSLTTVHILPVGGNRSYGHSLKGFYAVKTLNIYYCSFPQHSDLDTLLDECASTLERLNICGLNCMRWSTSSFGDIVPSEKLQTLSISSLHYADSAPLQYILCKFPNVSKLLIKPLNCFNRSQEIGDVFWSYLLRLYSRIACVHLRIALRRLDLPSLVANSLHVLSQLNRNKRVFSITSPDSMPSCQGASASPSVTLIKSEKLLHFKLVTYSTKDSVQQISDNIHDWIQLYKPTRVAYSSVEQIAFIYVAFFKKEKTVANAMNQALPKRYSNKSWKLLMEAINTADEIELEDAVLCNSPPPSTLFNHNRQSPLSTLKFSKCIINCNALPEISRRLPEIDLLTFHCTNILQQGKHTLEIFMPFTKVNRLYINAASLEAKIWPGKTYGYDSSSPVKDESFPYFKHYTLKIQTDSRTAIYTIRGQNSEQRVDLSADEVMCGDRRNMLVWVKCKSFGKYGIFCQDGLWSYYNFDHEQKSNLIDHNKFSTVT